MRRTGAAAGHSSFFENGGAAFAWTGGDEAAATFASTTVVVVGEIDNARLLAPAFSLGAGAQDAIVIATAVARDGERALARLRGRFVVAGWDAATERGFVAADHLGTRSVFLRDADSVLFASELKWLLRMLQSAPEPDDAAVAEWLVDRTVEPQRTFYRGIRRLASGEAARFDGSTLKTAAYWTPAYATPVAATAGEHVHALRSAVDRATARRLRRAPVGVLLSGGVDSSAVAASARATIAEAPLHAYSLVFPEVPAVDESRLIAATTAALSMQSVAVAARPGSSLQASLAYLREWRFPSASPNLFLHLPLIFRARRDGIAVLVDGQGGDELFGASPYAIADALAAGRAGTALRLARRLRATGASHPLRRFGFGGLVPVRVARAVERRRRDRPPEWLTERAAASYDARSRGEWRPSNGPRWWRHLVDTLITQRQCLGIHDFLRHKHALGGVPGAHPFLDDLELIEHVLRIPPELAFDARFDRPLLRAAARNRLPSVVINRTEKSFFDSILVESITRVDLPAIQRLLTDPHARIGAYVRRRALHAAVERASPARGLAWAWALWRFATAECWLRNEEDPDAVVDVADGSIARKPPRRS